jgi:hypothetical protein
VFIEDTSYLPKQQKKVKKAKSAARKQVKTASYEREVHPALRDPCWKYPDVYNASYECSYMQASFSRHSGTPAPSKSGHGNGGYGHGNGHGHGDGGYGNGGHGNGHGNGGYGNGHGNGGYGNGGNGQGQGQGGGNGAH